MCDFNIRIKLNDYIIKKSQTVSCEDNPEFNRSFYIPINQIEITSLKDGDKDQTVKIEIINDITGEEIVLGILKIPLFTLLDQNEHDFSN